MAKPDTDDGWYKLSHELDAALAVADFRKGERVVLREVFSQVFGKAKRKTATLSPKAISERCGISAANVCHAVTGLMSGNVLSRVKDGTYCFLKDYETWTCKGAPRLSKEEVAYAKSAVKTALSYSGSTTVEIMSNETTDKQSQIVQRDTIENGRLSNETIQVVPLDNQIMSNETIGVAAPPDPPHGNAHAEFKTNKTFKSAAPATLPIRAHADEEPFHAEESPDDLDKELVGYAESLELVRRELGESTAITLESRRWDIPEISGKYATKPAERWACYRGGVREVKRRLGKPGTIIKNPHWLAVLLAKDYAATGIPAPTVALETPKKREPVPLYMLPVKPIDPVLAAKRRALYGPNGSERRVAN